MEYRKHFAAVRNRPGQVGIEDSWEAAVAYILGYDDGNAGGLLLGFEEWLIPKLGEGNNRAWPSLVTQIALPNDASPPFTHEQDNTRRSVLFDLLDEFFALKGPLARRKVFDEYSAWLHEQPWGATFWDNFPR
jgi:hypothetical protein